MSGMVTTFWNHLARTVKRSRSIANVKAPLMGESYDRRWCGLCPFFVNVSTLSLWRDRLLDWRVTLSSLEMECSVLRTKKKWVANFNSGIKTPLQYYVDSVAICF